MKSRSINFWKLVLSFVIVLTTGCASRCIDTAIGTPDTSPLATSAPTNVPTFTPVISSTGGKIAFVSTRDGKFAVYVMNADGSDLQNLTAHLAYSSNPAWSPDGRYIAFSGFQEGEVEQIYVMKADGSELRQVTHERGRMGAHRPVWSPDGQYILFLSERDGALSNNRGIPVAEIYRMKADGSEPQRITNNRDFERYFSWSPKEDVLAVSANVYKPFLAYDDVYIPRYDIERIYLMGLDGVIQRQLTESGCAEDPTWSPSGEHIAFVSSGDGESSICVMKADGSDQICLIKSINTNSSSLYVNNLAPSWSPDGNYIIFSSNRDGDYDLYVMKADGSDLTRLTNEPGDEMFPVWSPVP